MSTMTSDEKIQNISEHLKNNVIVPAEEEKTRIIAEANSEKEAIIADAEKRAAAIIKDAEEKAKQEKANMESALRVAAKQAKDSLKIAFEKEVLKQSIEAPVKEMMSDENVLKEFVSEIVKLYLGQDSKDEIELVISAEMKTKLEKFIKSDVVKKTKEKMAISEESIPSGFTVVFTEGNIMLDFSTEAVVELLAEYLRPALRGYLFEK